MAVARQSAMRDDGGVVPRRPRRGESGIAMLAERSLATGAGTSSRGAASRPSRVACPLPPTTLGHHFGRVRLHQARDGETGCDVSVGTTSTTIFSPPACYRHCVERHEAVHAKDLASCCARAHKAHDRAKTDEAKQKVQEKFNTWVLDNEDFLECRAYAESAKCGQQYLDQHCGAKKEQDAGLDTTEEDRTELVSLKTDGRGDGEAGPMDGEEMVAQEAEPLDETPAPERCCEQMKRYRRVMAGRRDTVCERAKKTLGACPF